MFSVVLFALFAAADPCTYLPEAVVREIFELPVATPISTAKAHSCTYIWRGAQPSAAQLRDALIAGKQLPKRDSESVSLQVEEITNAAQTVQLRYATLSKGYTVDRDGRQLVVKPQKLEWVESFGERAYWNETLSQLVVARKNELLSVVVKKPSLRSADLKNLAETVMNSVLRK